MQTRARPPIDRCTQILCPATGPDLPGKYTQKLGKNNELVYSAAIMLATSSFTPRLDTLPAAQRRLWNELGDVPPAFTLYGGTAIALHLGHRESVDFDFFGRTGFDPDHLLRSVGFLSGAEVIQRQADTLTVRVDRGGPVLISFFATPWLGRIEDPVVAPQIHLKIASLIDLAGMKADVVQKRAEAKDYSDLDALILSGLSLTQALAAACALLGEEFNPQITLKALAYFADGNLATLPEPLKRRLQEAVRGVDLSSLPVLQLAKDEAWDRRSEAP